MNTQTMKLTVLAMLSAIAYVVMVFARIPLVPSAPFLKYEPKDAVIVIAGFIYGPLAAFMTSATVSLVEMFSVSDTGIIGFFMNVVSTSAFACTAAGIYKRVHTLKGAIAGLIVGAFAMSAAMLLWNYLLTPIYMGLPRDVVVGMLLPVFLPFNLIKSGINAFIAFVLYKPLKKALAKLL